MSVLSVLELNEYIKDVFDNNPRLQSVSVKGEISNFIHHRSGHMYFTLKDEDSQQPKQRCQACKCLEGYILHLNQQPIVLIEQ